MKTFNEIKQGMAKAFFASAWADQVEENGASLSGLEIFDVIPAEIDPAAIHAADTLVSDMIHQYKFDDQRPLTQVQKLLVLYMMVANAYAEDTAGADRVLCPELFGHYCAMQAMDTGVGLESFGHAAREAIKIPYLEFGSHSLERDYAF